MTPDDSIPHESVSPNPDGAPASAPRRAPARASLLTLGSAAVLAVYSAGYVRTRAAAAAIEREVAARPSRGATAARELLASTTAAPAVDASGLHHTSAAALDAVTDSSAPTTASPRSVPASSAATTTLTDGEARSHARSPVASANADKVPPTPTLRAAPAVAPSAGDTASNGAPATKTVKSATPIAQDIAAKDSAPAVATPQSAATVASNDSTPSVASGAANDSAKAALPPLRDGTFTGYGTSRHGDIEATIEIRDGRITAATISQCLTRYSCSWIEMLPAQVVARQTADVDVVSGATQSSDAFYFAVLAALKLSRGK